MPLLVLSQLVMLEIIKRKNVSAAAAEMMQQIALSMPDISAVYTALHDDLRL